ncbi:CBS domain-containing protein, partial [bacterium]
MLRKKEIDRIERFVKAFNGIEQYFKSIIGKGAHSKFGKLLSQYCELDCRFRYRGELTNLSHLRNILVHSPTKINTNIAIPTNDSLKLLEKICEGLTNPKKVISQFKTDVVTVSLDDNLIRVFQIIKDYDYSQLPVYDRIKFCGLLTENGITRWMAHQEVNKMENEKWINVLIEEVIREEETSDNVKFIDTNTILPLVITEFSNNPLLEAMLITD